MCGRFKRKSDKQRVAQVFEVKAGLEDTDFAPGDDLRPQSMQLVVFTNEAGERQIEMMRWGSNFPTACSSMRARRGIAPGKFLEGCVSHSREAITATLATEAATPLFDQ